MRGEITLKTNEEVKYSYELDISSLQKGTKQAITAMQKQIDYMTGITNKSKRKLDYKKKKIENKLQKPSNKGLQ